MARFGIVGRLLLILLSALLAYGAGTLLLLQWQATHPTKVSPFLRVRHFAADIDLIAVAPPHLWPAIIHALAAPEIRVSIEPQPSLDGFIPAPRLQARLLGFARSDAAALARVYTSADQTDRSPIDDVEGYLALAVLPLTDGRALIARSVPGGNSRTRPLGLPLGLWVGLSGAAVALLAVGCAIRELRPLRALTRSLQHFDGRQTLDPIPAGAPDVRALADAVATMQRRIAALLRERTLMVGAISHDLRTLLTRLQLRLGSLAEDELRRRCTADLDAMGGLITNALAYARGTDVGLRRERLDLADVVATEIAEREAVGTTLPIQAELVDAPVLGDRAALRRVVANLLDNAIRFGCSQLLVTVRAEGDRIQFVIEDDGPGVPPSEREAVLLPFHRVEGSRSRETGGTGLGLAIATRIVEAHGGNICVDASRWGGAMVSVWLPKA